MSKFLAGNDVSPQRPSESKEQWEEGLSADWSVGKHRGSCAGGPCGRLHRDAPIDWGSVIVYNQLISKCRDSLMWFKMPVPHHSLPERQILSSYPGDYVWNSTLIYTFQKLSEVHPGVLGISGCLSSSLTSSLWASCSCFKGNIKVTISRIFKPESGGQLAQWWGWVRSRGRRSRARLEKLFPLHTSPSRHRAPFDKWLNKRNYTATIAQRCSNWTFTRTKITKLS